MRTVAREPRALSPNAIEGAHKSSRMSLERAPGEAFRQVARRLRYGAKE
ncbi:hypothetical protein J2793_005912 [Paraburkholderia caledonica]|uniref:Uncharacterized protein n=1 Tax=Paraburkholderia caledonica TaxID=134536 RepID=A0AB73IKL6_9BURK|nr:hypothetical protein [Paraburkholderia caledonica]